MPIHPDVAARFVLLEGLTSMREARASAAGRERLAQFDAWQPAVDPSRCHVQADAVPGPHGPVPVRVYRPVSAGTDVPCLVWLHGGGFLGGDLDMPEADWTAREVSARVGAVVVSVDYRLATGGVSYPVPHDDTVAVAAWVRDAALGLDVDPERICLGGASAGANLAAGAALKLRDRDGWLPAGLILAYPMLHPVVPSPSRTLSAALAELPALFRGSPSDDFLVTNYLGGSLSSADGYSMPALAVLEGLCPTLVLNAEYDQLRASGEAFTAALALAGVDVRQVMARGVLHGFLQQPASLEPVDRSIAAMTDFMVATWT